MSELLRYSVNGEMNTNENQAGSGQNPVINAQSLTPTILNRGAAASLGSDYFTSITPTDPYRVGRYVDNRGPNSILFGLGAPGGLINESSKVAVTSRNAAVRAPDGTPGVTASALKVRDSRLYPANVNAAGPGMYREQRLRNYTLMADWQPLRALAINFAHNCQYSKALVNLMTGGDPTLRGDANRTLGVNGPPNPYAGRLYYDGNWRRDVHVGEVTATRLAASSTLDTKSKWLGRHRFAGMVSQAEQFDVRYNSWLAFAGRPITANDAMIAYSRKFARLPGRVRFQLNVSNVLDKTDILPVRIATGAAAPDGFMLPGGRGLAYSRYDLVAPREFRFTTTWSY